VEAWLHEEAVPFDTVEELARYLGAIVLGGHVARLPEELRYPFTLGVAEKMAAVDGTPVLDYVRLNIEARKSA
jgi:hypothetical protein